MPDRSPPDRRCPPCLAAALCGWLASAACSAAPDPAASRDASAGDVTADAAPDVSPYSPETWRVRIDLGKAQTGLNGLTPPLTFQVPPGTTSFAVTVRGPQTLQYTLAALSGPGPVAIVPKGWLGISSQPWLCLDPCTNRIAAAPAEAAFLVPNTPNIAVTPGLHTLRAYAFDYQPQALQRSPAPAEVSVHVDLISKPVTSKGKGRIDLNLCLTGANGITAAIALQHPRIAAAVDAVRTALGQAGITLGEVRAFDVPADKLIVTHDYGADADLSDLFASGAGLPMGINVFLVEAIYLASDPQGGVPTVVLGLSGGVPGPPLAVGGLRSGIALSLQLSLGQPDMLGRAMAHELGHFLGLFHTSEQGPQEPGDPAIHDTLPDTQDNDPDNLMYWLVGDADEPALTPGQAWVLHGNPWVVPGD